MEEGDTINEINYIHVSHFPQESSDSLPCLIDRRVEMTSRKKKENCDVVASTPSYSKGTDSILDMKKSYTV
jgi:hypothetical protein